MTTTWLHAERAIIGDGNTVLNPVWFEIDGPYIKRISEQRPDKAHPEDTKELGDVTLTPGLFNLHDHICRKYIRDSTSALTFSQRAKLFMQEDTHYLLLHSVYNARQALREGVTYLRDFGLGGYSSIHLRRAIREGLIIGPDLSACGKPICMTGGHTYRQAHEADGADGIRTAVREELRVGADVIKFMASGGLEHFPTEDPRICELTEDEMRAGVEVAHEADIPTAAHCYPTRAILRTIKAGIDTVEHGVFLNDECIDLMIKTATALVPTMCGLRGVARYLANTPENENMRQELQKRIYIPHTESVKKAISAGILVGTGTDTSGQLNEEIRLIASIMAYTPVQALAHATSISAKIARREDLGLLQEGKRANIVAFQGDLTKSLDRLEHVVWVWKNGQVVPKYA